MKRSEAGPAGRRLLLGAGVVLALAAGVVLFLFDPATAGFYPRCPSRLLTGLDCPGCGTLRALHRLLHGDLAGAFRMNAAAVLAIPLVLYYGASSLRVARGGAPLPGGTRLGRSGLLLAGLFVAWAVARNVVNR